MTLIFHLSNSSFATFQDTGMSGDPLKLLPFDVSRVRTQDVVVVTAVLAAVFLFRAPNVWELKPSWQLDIASAFSQNTDRNSL